jgi:putative spermidine/putrescine transport system permease protein
MKHAFTLLMLFLLFVVPVVVLALTSLAPGWRFPDLWPGKFSFQAFAYIIRHHQQIIAALGSSFLFAFLTALVTLPMCLLPAAVFARREFAGKALLEGMLLTPALVPPMTFAMGLHFVFIKLSLTDTMTGVVLLLAMFSYPYMFRALVAGFQSMGEEYRICARNLGAKPLVVTWRVELPLLVPAVIAGGSVVFLVAFSEYFLVFLIGGGNVASFTGTLFPLLTSSNRSLAAVLTLIFLLLPIFMFLIVDTVLTRIYRRKGMR